MPTLSIDIETYSNASLPDVGVYRYADDPSFEILLFAYAFDDEDVRVVDLAQGEKLPKHVLAALLDPAVTKSAFNAQFERVCIGRHLGRILLLAPEGWHCTMVHAWMLGLSGGLDDVAKAVGLPPDKQKMFIGKNLIRLFSIPRKPSETNGNQTRYHPYNLPLEWQRFKDYCAQDVVAEREIRKRLEAYPMPETELTLYHIDQHINDYGVRLDSEFVTQAMTIDRAYTEELTEEYKALTGLANPNSTTQLKEWLSRRLGYPVRSVDRRAVADLLTQADEYSEVQRALELRQQLAKTSTSKYSKMDEVICGDGKAHGLLQFYGARTGRWAGRLIQVQNLPRNSIEELDLARQVVRSGDLELLEMLYSNIPAVLSQLIRTAFVPSEGCRFIVSDFSAIEARVIAWYAGEQWRLDVFNSHGRIYEASAAAMFGVPVASIDRGSPLRQKGKIAELALGYQGGVGALKQMGALDMGLKEEELPGLVDQWRIANPRIVQFWSDVDSAAKIAIGDQTTVNLQKGLQFSYTPEALFIKLPSGRRLAYPQPQVEQHHSFAGTKITFEGQELGQLCRVDTYGGKLVENCLAGDTLVLTNAGWKVIRDITACDLLWDGCCWVAHQGLVEKGLQETIDLNGVRLTPDHLVLIERGWVNASSCEGLDWPEVRLPHGYELCGIGREEVPMGSQMRLRESPEDASYGVPEGENEVLRLPEAQADKRITKDTRYVKAPGVCCVAVHARPLPASFSSSLAELWRTGNFGLRKLAGEFREFLGRYGADIREQALNRSNRCRRRLHARELPMGISENPMPEQTVEQVCEQPFGAYDCLRTLREKRTQQKHPNTPAQQQCSARTFARSAGRYEPVCDILNAGPRSRFTVLSDSGPLIVHNCVQATARDCLGEALMRLHDAGYRIAFHVHDEVVLDVPMGHGSVEEVNELMSRDMPWAPGLPLRAAGFECSYYQKD